jgi:hypothetical protein
MAPQKSAWKNDFTVNAAPAVTALRKLNIPNKQAVRLVRAWQKYPQARIDRHGESGVYDEQPNALSRGVRERNNFSIRPRSKRHAPRLQPHVITVRVDEDAIGQPAAVLMI